MKFIKKGINPIGFNKIIKEEEDKDEACFIF